MEDTQFLNLIWWFFWGWQWGVEGWKKFGKGMVSNIRGYDPSANYETKINWPISIRHEILMKAISKKNRIIIFLQHIYIAIINVRYHATFNTKHVWITLSHFEELINSILSAKSMRNFWWSSGLLLNFTLLSTGYKS